MVKESRMAYSPPQVAEYTLAEIKRRRDADYAGVTMGIPDVDAKMNPLRPGDLISLIGRPGHYKSGLAQWWAREIAHRIREEDDSDDVVVYVTCEMAIEELGLYDLTAQIGLDATQVSRGRVSDNEWSQLEAAAMRRSILPLWLLGHSLARRRERQRISMYTIEKALFWIEDNMDFRARVIFLDYLNLLKSVRQPGHEPTRRIQITEIVHTAKDMALNLGCPVVMVAQAHRRVDEREWKLPKMADCMESASIEQFSEKVLSVWYPKVTDQGQTIRTPAGDTYEVDNNLLFLGLLKQKHGPAGGFFTLYVDPARNEIKPMARTSDIEDIPLDPEEIPLDL